MLPIDKIESLVARARELDRTLCEPGVTDDMGRYLKLSRERADLEPLVESFARHQDLMRRLEEDRAAMSDPELRELVQEEIPQLEGEIADVEGRLTLLLLPPDPNDARNTILEIRAGEGGDEAGALGVGAKRIADRERQAVDQEPA